jgi:hypothetical protein
VTNQQQAEPFAPAPPRFYWTLHLESAAQRARARDRGETRAVDEFIATVNKAADLIARLNPDPEIRAEGYRNKPANLWAEQFMYFVEDCAEDWADWEKIAPQDENLREEMIMQIEALLAEAGIDLRDDDIHKSSAKLERFLADAESTQSPTPAQPPAALPAPRGSSGAGTGGQTVGPAYP